MAVLPPLRFVASPNYSSRTTSVDLVVLHDTEGSYAGAVSWFRSSASQVSAHIVLSEDGSEATQMVPYSKKAWHCAAFNSRSIGVEMAGIARLGFRSAELRTAARVVAFLCHKHRLPARYVKPSRNGAMGKGFTLHQDLGEAGGGHHDPGFSRTKALWFAGLVRWEARRGDFRTSWGTD